MVNAIDQVNLRRMNLASVVRCYVNNDGLAAYERAALESVMPAARGKRILDIGVGGGRTVVPLMEVSEDYLGIDYSREMIKACRPAHPGARLELLDARQMEGIGDDSVFLAMFGCNGVCMVSHEDRVRILREVFRVLEPGGVFLFSTFNRDSPQHVAGFRLPPFGKTRNPLRMVRNAISYARQVAIFAINRVRFRRLEVRTATYSIINDVWHKFGTMEYYITVAEQRRQLEEIGFARDAVVFDEAAKVVTTGSASHSVMFVARKPG